MSEETKKQLKDMSEKVLQAIKTGNVSMHSRYYFFARSALWILGVILVFSLTLYLMSFITFVFRGNALSALLAFGSHGWLVLLTSLPWLLLLATFAIFVALQLLSLHFSFVYRRPLVHTALASIVVLVAGSALMAQTTLHEHAYELSRERRLPIAGPIYRIAIGDRDDRHIGIITAMNDEVFTIRGRDGEVFYVNIATSTRIPRGRDFAFATGTPIVVFGDLDNDDDIDAVGIQPLDRCPTPFHCDREKPPMKY